MLPFKSNSDSVFTTVLCCPQQPDLSGETMKKTHRFCLVSVLTLVLTTATFAGQIDTPGIAAPPPQPPASASAMTPGEIPTGIAKEAESANTLLDEIALALLQTVLSMI
jgi:hypothetical protein